MDTVQTAVTTTGRAAYYRAEAARVWRMADELGSGVGRERFEQVAREYRSLAYRIDPDGDPPDLLPELRPLAPELIDA